MTGPEHLKEAERLLTQQRYDEAQVRIGLARLALEVDKALGMGMLLNGEAWEQVTR